MEILRTQYGFTLAELLIALAILGVIATFTIPKILDSGSNAEWNAKAKEYVATMSEAYQNYKLQNTVTNSTGISDLTPFINYVRRDTVTTIDRVHGDVVNTNSCSGPTIRCYLLHNGAMLWHWDTTSFNDSSSTNAIRFNLDPDGQVTGTTTNGPGKSVQFFLYRNGRVTSRGFVDANTCDSNGCVNPALNNEPTWFSWSN